MKFNLEFELSSPFEIKNYKSLRKNGLAQQTGEEIAKAFGVKEIGFINKNGEAGEYLTLEIEAFPMDKWLEFKKQLTGAINYDIALMNKVIYLLSGLESFGTPVGEKI